MSKFKVQIIRTFQEIRTVEVEADSMDEVYDREQQIMAEAEGQESEVTCVSEEMEVL